MSRKQPTLPLSAWERDAVACIDEHRDRFAAKPPSDSALAQLAHRVLVLDEPRPRSKASGGC